MRYFMSARPGVRAWLFPFAKICEIRVRFRRFQAQYTRRRNTVTTGSCVCLSCSRFLVLQALLRQTDLDSIKGCRFGSGWRGHLICRSGANSRSLTRNILPSGGRQLRRLLEGVDAVWR